METNTGHDTTTMAASLVAAYIAKNPLPAGELPGLLVQIHRALMSLSMSAAPPEEQTEKATPAQVRKSITPDALISFIDGKSYKTLKRHLGTHGLTFETYRTRYGLPADYPTVAANYSAARSTLARQLGLGQQRRAAPPEPAPAPAAATKPKRAGRPRKTAELA